MAKYKSILKTTHWEIARAKRRCKHSNKHAIKKGDHCFVISEGYTKWNYCEQCGINMIEYSMQNLEKLKDKTISEQ